MTLGDFIQVFVLDKDTMISVTRADDSDYYNFIPLENAQPYYNRRVIGISKYINFNKPNQIMLILD